MEDVVQGTVKKVTVTIEPIGNTHLKDCDFKACFYTFGQQCHTIEKDAATAQTDDSYMFVLDTALVGTGHLYCDFIVYVPDADVEGMVRPEILLFDMEMNIIKSRYGVLAR